LILRRKRVAELSMTWLLVWAFAGPLLGQGTPYRLGVSPLRVDVKMPAGQAHTETIRVTSDGDEPVHMRAAAADWYFNENDAPEYVRAGKLPSYSCGQWLRINPTEFDVPAKGAIPVRFTVVTPPGGDIGGYHCAVLVEMVPPPLPALPQTGLRTLLRFATSVYVVMGDPPAQGEVVSLDLAPAPPEAAVLAGAQEKPRWEHRLTLRNTGRTHFRVTATLEVKDQEGKTISQFKIESQPVLPESQREFKLYGNEELAPGDYQLTASIDIGLKSLLQAEKKVRIEANAPEPPPASK